MHSLFPFLFTNQAVVQLLLHFFPLLTIFLFCSAAVFFIRYVISIQKIEKHMESNRPMEWEAMGKPSVFSGKYSENNIKFKNLVDSEKSANTRDEQVILLWERSKQIKQSLTIITWSAFGTYFFTIFAVRFLMNQLHALQ